MDDLFTGYKKRLSVGLKGSNGSKLFWERRALRSKQYPEINGIVLVFSGKRQSVIVAKRRITWSDLARQAFFIRESTVLNQEICCVPVENWMSRANFVKFFT